MGTKVCVSLGSAHFDHWHPDWTVFGPSDRFIVSAPTIVEQFPASTSACLVQAFSIVPSPLMSSGAARAAYLRLEDQLIAALARIEELERRVSDLEVEREAARFEVVGDTHVSASVVESSPTAASVPASAPASVISIDTRTELLVQIGVWIRNCLQGRRRGLSGREKLPESNQVYIVFKAFAGAVLNPVAVYHHYTDLIPEVKPGGYPGDSVFIGLPSSEDARIVVASAGCDWPQ